MRIVTSTIHDVAARADNLSANAIQVSGLSSLKHVKNAVIIAAHHAKWTNKQSRRTDLHHAKQFRRLRLSSTVHQAHHVHEQGQRGLYGVSLLDFCFGERVWAESLRQKFQMRNKRIPFSSLRCCCPGPPVLQFRPSRSSLHNALHPTSNF